MISVTTEGKELLDSKTFHALGLGETTVVLGQGNEALHFVLNFVQKKGEKPSLEWSPRDDRTLDFTLVNWDSALGTTSLEPLEVGTFSDRRLFILFSVRKVGSEGQLRKVTFSAYLGERVEDGAD